jgi:hypothetical protein
VISLPVVISKKVVQATFFYRSRMLNSPSGTWPLDVSPRCRSIRDHEQTAITSHRPSTHRLSSDSLTFQRENSSPHARNSTALDQAHALPGHGAQCRAQGPGRRGRAHRPGLSRPLRDRDGLCRTEDPGTCREQQRAVLGRTGLCSRSRRDRASSRAAGCPCAPWNRTRPSGAWT